MHTWLATGLMGRVIRSRRTLALVAVLAVLAFALPVAFAQQGQAAPPTSQVAAAVNPQTGAATQETAPATPASETGGEANLKLPDLSQVSFLNGINGSKLLTIGLIFCALGLLFGLMIYVQLKNLPVHRSMREISELIYETCKTYLITQGKFILILEAFIAVVIVLYFGILHHEYGAAKVIIILAFSLVGIIGSYGVAWFGIRVNTFANSRTAFAGLRGKPYPIYAIPLKAGMSIGMMLISVELLIMLCILLFIPGSLAGACFIGFAIGESLGAAALRIAGGIFTKIADIGSDLMKIVFKIKEDDARNPGVIADCTGDNAGDSVGPSADGFETYGVTGVALIAFILAAVHDPIVQVQLLVWIFVMRIMMLVSSAGSYFINEAVAKARYGNSDHMNFETPLTSLVWLTSVVSIILTFIVSKMMIPDTERRRHAVVEAGRNHLVRHAGRGHHPRTGQGIHLDEFQPCEGNRDVLRGRRRITQHSIRPGGRQLLRVLAGPEHGHLDGSGLLLQHHGTGRGNAGACGFRLRPGGVRLPRHGPGDDRRGLLWAGHRQCAIGVRTLID